MSQYSFIFPRAALSETNSTELAYFASSADPRSLITVPLDRIKEAEKRKVARFTTVAYRVPHEKMTRLRNVPSNFGSLARILSARGVDLVADLRTRMKEWYGAQKSDAGRLASLLAIIVEFPIIEPDGKLTNVADTRGFVPSCKLGDLGVAIGALYPAGADQGSQSGYAPALAATVDQAALDESDRGGRRPHRI